MGNNGVEGFAGNFESTCVAGPEVFTFRDTVCLVDVHDIEVLVEHFREEGVSAAGLEAV
ncbi:MAG: hypothetical protein R3248_14410 [Candidatus Promineifilaceae bacterium]|nr:hypothetical protein [Candidatus Promineifilaceae bacterium]